MTSQNKRRFTIAALLFAILLAAFTLRFARIDTLPSGIFPDEAQNGVDAQEANATGNYKLFYENNNGREGLFINIQAMSIKYIGNTVIGLKLPSIIFGTLTVLGVFLLAAELFQSQLAGLMGAYMIAFSYWAINFSRIGFRAIMLPFILSFAFYFLFKGLRTKKFSDFILAGFIYGLGLHTYIAFRVSPLILVVLFAILLINKRDFLKDYWKHTLVFAIAMFIAAAPMLLDFFVWNPQHYSSRTSEISVLNPAVNQGHLIPTVARTFALSLAKYNFWGDQNMRQNYPPYPILNPLTGVAFLFGLIYIFIQFFRLLWLRFKKDNRDTRLVLYAFLLAWFFTMLIPEFLAAEGNPHALRSIGTLPVVMLIAVIPFIWIFKKYHSFGHGFKIFTLSMLAAVLLFIGIADPIKYFVFFANSPQQHGAFAANLMEVSDYVRSLPAAKDKYVVTGSMERLTIRYLNPSMPNLFYAYPDQAKDIHPANLQNFEIIFTGADWDTINATRDRFPNIRFEEHRNNFGDTFYVLKF
ncbi:MAG TPA: glycosyltransferase family 39 protein [Patescibacteria group bacterium]